MPSIAISSWSVHRLLGRPAMYGPGDDPHSRSAPQGGLTLLELPAQMAAHGFFELELVHFHLPATDATSLAQLRNALRLANVRLQTLLIDAGDITDPVHGTRDLAWISAWLPVAAALGARSARVISGKQTHSVETMTRSIAGLRTLSVQAASFGLRLVIENWFSIADNPEHVHALLDQLDGKIGLKLDFGNWDAHHGAGKYAALARIAARAESTHAKGRFTAAYSIDVADYKACLLLMRDAAFRGAHTLIYDDPAGPDEWRGLELEREIVQAHA